MNPTQPTNAAVLPRPVTSSRLLVSVTSLQEATAAAALGVDIVDLKDPQRGALGAADPSLWRAVAGAVESSAVLSAALGEAREEIDANPLPACFGYAKAGPAGCQDSAELVAHWQRIGGQLPPSVRFVPVAYADHAAACCPPAETILRAAIDAGLRYWLIDTFTKDGRTTIDHLGTERLQDLDRMARAAGVQWVLAGSLRLETLPRPWPLRPHLVGLRGDVCRGGRSGPLSPARVKIWQKFLSELE